MKKICITANGTPKNILEASANDLVANLMKAFPHVKLDARITNTVQSVIPEVDDIVKDYFGDAWLTEKELRTFVDVTLEKAAMYALSSKLMPAEEVSVKG